MTTRTHIAIEVSLAIVLLYVLLWSVPVLVAQDDMDRKMRNAQYVARQERLEKLEAEDRHRDAIQEYQNAAWECSNALQRSLK